jgi:hypothetical protein
VALAQAEKQSPPTGMTTPSKESEDQIKARAAAWFKQCMQDWDAQTHMTKQEWERTCRRVTLERGKFLLDQSKDSSPQSLK